MSRAAKGRGAAKAPPAPARPRGGSIPWYDFEKRIQRTGPRGVYAFCGPETLLKREALAELTRALAGGEGEGGAGRYAVDSFRIGEHEVGAILSAASQAGLFGGDRLVWVEGLDKFTRLSQRDRDAWFEMIASGPANPVVLVAEQTSREMSRRAKALAEILGSVTVVDFWRLHPEKAIEWVRKRGERLGLRVSAEAAKTLVRHLGADLQTLATELEKISLVCASGKLGEQDLRELSRRGVLSSSWECVEHVLAGTLREALESLQSVRREESSFSFAWKLNQAVARSLAETSGSENARGFGGWRGERERAKSTSRLTERQKKSLGRLLWGCYEWERNLKTGRWAGARDYAALEALVIAHMDRLRSERSGT
ncbi:MAG: hypothetical protein V1774_11690 [Candidatus Eisenbacteria bacterium]